MSLSSCPCVGPCTCAEPDTGIPLVNDANAINYGPTSILEWGADPTGNFDCTPAFLAAFAYLNNFGTVYIPGGTYAIKTDLTVPAGITLQFWGGELSTGYNIVLTILGSIKAPFSEQIFQYTSNYSTQPYIIVSKSTITPYHFGAVGNGAADDTLAMQTAINAVVQGSLLDTFDVYEQGSSLFLPQGNFGISGTLTIANCTGFEMTGISRSGSSIRWVGTTAGLSMVQLLNCSECAIRRLSVIGSNAHPPKAGIESQIATNLSPTFTATGNIFEDLIIGSSGSNAMQKGILYSKSSTGNNQDNDVGLFRRVEISNCSVAGVSFEMFESISHTFVDCTILSCVIGVACTLGGASTGGQFEWYGGDISDNTTVDFATSGEGNLLISGVQCESSSRFLTTNANPGSAPQAILISGVRWAGDALASDHRWIQVENAAALTVQSCIIGDGASHMPQIYVDLQNSALPVQINLIGNHYAMPSAYQYDPIQNSTASSPETYIYYSGNVYDDVNGAGYRREQVTASWTPNISNGSTGSVTASLPVNLGDVVGFSVQAAVPVGVSLTASVASAGTVQLSAYNGSGSTWNPGALNVNFWLQCSVRANS